MAITKREAQEGAAQKKSEQQESQQYERDIRNGSRHDSDLDSDSDIDVRTYRSVSGEKWEKDDNNPVSYDWEEWRIYVVGQNLHIDTPDDDANFPLEALYDLLQKNGLIVKQPPVSDHLKKVRDKVESMIFHFKDTKSMAELLRVIDGN